MPLILVCGYPCSGKTRIVEKLNSYFIDKSPICISFESLLFVRKTIYLENDNEKLKRIRIKDEFISKITGSDPLIILETVGNIDSYRNELVSEATGRSVVIIVQCSYERAIKNNNDDRKPDKYDEDTINRLIKKFDAPHNLSREDIPFYYLIPYSTGSEFGENDDKHASGCKIYSEREAQFLIHLNCEQISNDLYSENVYKFTYLDLFDNSRRTRVSDIKYLVESLEIEIMEEFTALNVNDDTLLPITVYIRNMAPITFLSLEDPFLLPDITQKIVEYYESLASFNVSIYQIIRDYAVVAQNYFIS